MSYDGACHAALSPVALRGHLSPCMVVLQAEKVLLFSQDTNLTALLLEAKDLEARVIILSARSVQQTRLGYLSGHYYCYINSQRHCIVKHIITTRLIGCTTGRHKRNCQFRISCSQDANIDMHLIKRSSHTV